MERFVLRLRKGFRGLFLEAWDFLRRKIVPLGTALSTLGPRGSVSVLCSLQEHDLETPGRCSCWPLFPALASATGRVSTACAPVGKAYVTQSPSLAAILAGVGYCLSLPVPDALGVDLPSFAPRKVTFAWWTSSTSRTCRRSSPREGRSSCCFTTDELTTRSGASSSRCTSST